jgi:hypothetical protein
MVPADHRKVKGTCHSSIHTTFVAARERMNGAQKMPFTYTVQQLFLCITEMLLVGEYLVDPEKHVAATRKINVTLQFLPLI